MPPKGHKITWSQDLTGFVTTAQNVGAGAGKVFRDEAPAGTLNFKSIAAGAGISVTNNADDITIASTVAVPTKTESEICLNAGDFVPAQAPFLPAPVENYYIAASGVAGKVIKLSPGVLSAASILYSTRWIAKPGTAFYTVNVQVNAFTDNASLNNIALNIYHYSNSNPAGLWNSAPVALVPVVNAGLGAYLMLRFNFQFTIAGDCLILVIERQTTGDTNPGTIYIANILMYFNTALT